jgi:hypothetical protein
MSFSFRFILALDFIPQVPSLKIEKSVLFEPFSRK